MSQRPAPGDVRAITLDARVTDPALVGATAARRERLLDAAKALGHHAVVLYSAGAHSMLAIDGVWWASGFKPMAESAIAIGPDGTFELWISPQWDLTRAQEAVGEHVSSAHDVLVAVSDWLERSGLKPEEVLVCGIEKIPARRYRAAVAAFGVHDATGSRLLLGVARRHDEYEQTLAAKAVEMAEVAYGRLLEQLHPGLGEFAVVAMLDGLLRELGSEDNFVLVAASQLNRSVHAPSERIVERGDVLLAEISPSIGGIFTQICRTVTMGPPGPTIEADFELLNRSFEAGLRECAPGRPVRGAALAMDAVLTEGGYGEYCRPPYMRARGHGLGIGSVLPGDVTVSSDQVFAEGDYFVLHPNQFLPTSGYLLCGEPVLIEADGARELSSRRGTLAIVEVA
jgi:Xaa-Pro aminopeptidase